MSLTEIKGFHVLTDSEPFPDQTVKNKQEANENRKKNYITRNTGCLFDYNYIKTHYILIAVDLIFSKRIRC